MGKRRWSKLQKDFYKLKVRNLDIQIHCNAYRMDTQYGCTDIPRYWITLNKEILWDYPKDFRNKHPDRESPWNFPYITDMYDISELIREYINTPNTEILSKHFENDHWGLINILRAADRRIGTRRFHDLHKKTKNKAARRILNCRMGV